MARGQNSRQVRAKLRNLAVGEPSNQIEPMRADVRDGAQLTAEFCFQAPVPVGGKQQPVLKKAPVNELYLPDGAFLNQHARFLAQGIVAEVVGDGADEAGFLQKRDERGRFPRIEREGFFAKNVFARAKQLAGFLKMEMIWRAEMNNLHRRIGGKFIERVVGARKMERFGRRFGSIGGAAKGSLDGNAKPAKGLKVRPSHKSQANDCGVQLHRVSLMGQVRRILARKRPRAQLAVRNSRPPGSRQQLITIGFYFGEA